MNYDEFFAAAIGRLWHERRGAIACSPTLSGSQADFPARSGIHRKDRVRS